jgi:hypothetical protein
VADARPSPLALELLKEFEADPSGVGFLDIDRLLNEWGVTETLQGEDLLGYRVRIHPAEPHFTFSYPLRDELSSASVLSICRAIRELDRRLRQ